MLIARGNLRLVRSLADCACGQVQRLVTAEKAAVGVTIGNFDGVHLGHQALFAKLDERLLAATSAGGETPVRVLLTFAPHPKAVLQGIRRSEYGAHPELWQITSLREKLKLLNDFHFDLVFVARFHRQFAAQSPDEFVKRYLIDALRARVVVVGHDWSFGRDRAGGIDTLERAGKQYGFETAVVPPQLISGNRVSSSAVKAALGRGDLDEVQSLLGRRFAFQARVVGGEQRGRTIGFPTANLTPTAQVLPADGVYACWFEYQSQRVAAVTNIGIRPTFGGGGRVAEAHLLDHRADLYGERVRLEFVGRLRDERRFSAVAELKEAIAADIAQARELLSRNPGR